MEFFLTMGLLALIAGLLSAAISVPIFRMRKSYAKPLAIVLGAVLFLFFSWAGFVLLIIISARAGHPF
jgi:hypothetical protein